MVPVIKKVILGGHVGPADETDNGSGGYYDSLDESFDKEMANVSDYEDGNPK